MVRPAIALDARQFGKRSALEPSLPAPRRPIWSAEDFRLFALTFTVGFLFVSILIG